MKARLLGCLLVAALASAGCSLPGSTTGPIEVTALFDDVGDLVANHSVQVADVRIGSVQSIELTDDFKAEVTLSVKDVDLPADVEAVLRTTSLLGEKFIELRPLSSDKAATGPRLQDGDVIATTREAPELEFVAEEAVQLLGQVMANDVATLVEVGAVGFAGRGEDLNAIFDDLSILSSALADQSASLVAIIDGLDKATVSLAAGDDDLDRLLVNLADTATLLADNRDHLVGLLEGLGRLAKEQNEQVFDPYLEQVDLQVKQLDGILDRVTAGRAEVGALLDWLMKFVQRVPLAVPNDFAQIYAWLIPGPLEAPN